MAVTSGSNELYASIRLRSGYKCSPQHSGGIVATLAQETFPEGDLERPAWAGGGPLTTLVNSLISFKPLFGLMKFGARQALISAAEKKGVAWRKLAADLRNSPEVYKEKELVENKSLVYPSYYLQEFHAYEKGNLCWEAAFEVEAATTSMCVRAIKSAPTVAAAVATLRGNWLQAVQAHHLAHSGGLPVRDVLDIGCGAGVSTRFLAEAFPDAHVTGLDASPYMLSVASYREKQAQAQAQGASEGEEHRAAAAGGRPPIRWVHALGEDTGLPSASFDLISLAYVMHECPSDANRALLKEAKRLLRPGGTFSMTDNSPKSKLLQELPPAVFTLMKATEPWSDEFFVLDLEQCARDAGFKNVSCRLTNERHRTFTATA
eukprot:jgi/Mesen1/2273/ME000154S01444